MMKLFIKEKGVNMDLEAKPIIKKLELAVQVAKEGKSPLLKGQWVPTDILETIIADYYREWNSMCDEHYKDYLKNKENKNETIN